MNIDVSTAVAKAGGSADFGGSAGFKVDVNRGERVGRVSSEWFSRPADERYLSLSELYAAVRARAERAAARTVESRAIRVEASRDDAERLTLIVPGPERPVAPTHWSFGQLAAWSARRPPICASFRRRSPAINLQYGLLRTAPNRSRPWRSRTAASNCAPSPVPTMAASTTTNWSPPCSGSPATAPAIRAGRCPACSTGRPMIYNPLVDITKDTTTLYASDRDVSVPGRRSQSDRGRAAAGRLARPLFPRLLLLELRGRRQDARHRLASIFAPSARTAISGASRISRRSPSATPNTPRRASPTRRRRR